MFLALHNRIRDRPFRRTTVSDRKLLRNVCKPTEVDLSPYQNSHVQVCVGSTLELTLLACPLPTRSFGSNAHGQCCRGLSLIESHTKNTSVVVLYMAISH